METFVAVVDSGRCIAAARRLDVSRSTVSTRLDRLEQAVGCRLLRRTTRHVGMTPAGESLLPEMRALVDAAAALRRRVGRVREREEGVIRIATVGHRRAMAVRVAGLLRRALPGWEVRIAVVGRRAMLGVFHDDLADLALGRVRGSRNRVRRAGIGGRPGCGETIAWRDASVELPVAAIARVAERVAAIVRRRAYPGPLPEMLWLSSVFAAVERLLDCDGVHSASTVGVASDAGAASRRPSGSGGGDAP